MGEPSIRLGLTLFLLAAGFLGALLVLWVFGWLFESFRPPAERDAPAKSERRRKVG